MCVLELICREFQGRTGDKNKSPMLHFYPTLSCLLPIGLLVSSPVDLAPVFPMTHFILIV